MFAVIKTGGKQYRVAANDLLKVEKVAGSAGDIVEFAEVLMVGVGAEATIGSPVVGGALVTAEVVEQGRARKVIAFKKRRRQNSKRTRGHRQELTTIRISEILTDGAKPSKKAAEKPAKKEAAPKAEAAAADATDPKAAPKAKAAPKKAAAKAEKPASGE
jgi:large subunit ribosomal protein L21